MSAAPTRRHAETSTTEALVSGTVADGFESVRAAFESNLLERGEFGAAVAVWLDGKPVVDLWGGYMDAGRRRRWERDTIVLVFSATKGLAAAALAVAHSRGLIDYGEPVCRYWPEFAQHGKERVTVRQLLAHQAGLCALDERLDPRKLADFEFLAKVLARQRPAWVPGRRHGYHAFTLGWYESELLRRVDPRGRRLPAFFAEGDRGSAVRRLRDRALARPGRIKHRIGPWVAAVADAVPSRCVAARDGARLFQSALADGPRHA